MYTTSSTSRRLNTSCWISLIGLGMGTLTTTSTMIDGIYMLSAPKHQTHRRNKPTIFEGKNKSDTTAGSTTTFKDWASEVQIYMSLEDHNINDILEDVKRESVPIYDEAFIEHELDKQGLSIYETEKRKDAEPQGQTDRQSYTSSRTTGERREENQKNQK
eukprot:3388133-Amphidinium_carterae.1